MDVQSTNSYISSTLIYFFNIIAFIIYSIFRVRCSFTLQENHKIDFSIYEWTPPPSLWGYLQRSYVTPPRWKSPVCRGNSSPASHGFLQMSRSDQLLLVAVALTGGEKVDFHEANLTRRLFHTDWPSGVFLSAPLQLRADTNVIFTVELVSVCSVNEQPFRAGCVQQSVVCCSRNWVETGCFTVCIFLWFCCVHVSVILQCWCQSCFPVCC